MCGWHLNGNLASMPAHSISLPRPAVENGNGAPRSDTNMKGDFGVGQCLLDGRANAQYQFSVLALEVAR